jgi:4-hydroxybutyrate dehydrogenase
MNSLPTISYLTDIYFRVGAVDVLPDLQDRFGISRPLIVTDKGIVRSGLLDRLKVSGAVVFDRVGANPTESSAVECLESYRQGNCDSLIAFGGGSPIDLAKCVALMTNHEPPLEAYAIRYGGTAKIRDAMPPLIAISTTAGSGSEVGRAALLTLSSGDKLGFLSRYLVPKAAICDPELTLTMPADLTAGTGMDAISHCVEALCSTRDNPVADAIAFDGLGRGYRNIERAFHDPLDRAARSEMMMCSLEGGLAFQKGLGAVHSLSHPLGALTEKGLHHGTLNAIFLPHVLRFNHEFCAEKMDRMAQTIGISRGTDLPEVFESLNQRLRLPDNLTALGLTRADLEPLAQKALEDHCTPTNPRPLDCNQLLQLYLEALY